MKFLEPDTRKLRGLFEEEGSGKIFHRRYDLVINFIEMSLRGVSLAPLDYHWKKGSEIRRKKQKKLNKYERRGEKNVAFVNPCFPYFRGCRKHKQLYIGSMKEKKRAKNLGVREE